MQKIHKLGKGIGNILSGNSGTVLMSGFVKLTAFIFILFFQSLYSQEGLETVPTISLTGNAKVYSTDPDFNGQFLSQENIDYQIINSGKVYVFKSKYKSSGKKIAKKQSKACFRSTNQASLKKIKQNISDFEQRKKSFNFCNIHDAPFSRELPYSSDFNSSYIAPSGNSNDFSKICVFQYKYLISLVLEYLYVWKYHYFNSRSLEFCFSKVFSVRPPPLSLS